VIPITRHRLWQLAADGVLVALAWWLAFQLRWDHGVPPPYHRLFNRSILVVVAITLVVFVLSGFYRRWWRYVSTRDMWSAARGVAIGCLISDLTVYFMHPVRGFPLPRGVAVLDFLLLLAFVAGSRLLARTITERPAPARLVVRGKEVIVVGAGDAAWQVVRQMLRTPELGYTPIGLIDDDPKKRHIQLEGVRVIGTTGELPRVLRDNPPDEILIAIPSAPGELHERVVEAARQARVPVKTVPGLHELISGRVSVSQIRPVQVEDLLGREAVEVDMDAIASYLKDEVVLVTGAGGSIGAELCRQIVRAGPNRLVLVDHGETPLFEIERELVDERGFAAVVPVLGDVKSETKMRQVFETYRPGVVFHAAAYKHVPMMEANPLESVRNNVLATKLVADVAVELGAERFVLVSTDKALNPAAVYGQSKAICEWIVEAYGARRDVSTRFVAVRFGNVLGSAGSVITIFRRQIEQGGPVTVTHPEMTRFFMTMPEAAQLIVQAGAIGGRGEIFVLDMGEPVRIVDLARDMITLSGREPGREVAIEFIGTRPGEKLHEDLFGEGETVKETPHPKIRRATRPPVDAAWLEDELVELERLVDSGETLEVVAKLAEMMREPQRSAAEPSALATPESPAASA
jgi:FlaA1/EpsC-like NDP-sugar epimerase